MADCTIRIQIGTGDFTYLDDLGFYLVKSPSELACSIKENNIVTTDFPEEDGESCYVPSTPKLKPFDYTISLVYFSNNLGAANDAIVAFYNSMLGKKITLYNDYKQTSVVGYAKGYKAGQFYRNEKDVVVFDITFYIPKPSECNFNVQI